ncbi:low-specificity L-threonine aldolase [Idiomarina sp. MD25a]|uniref:low-specificity L-threonine aldolase n=1 Tax=Idiomarina sp. MD25a TaxID=1889913 RepID=UPI0008F92C1E|nr:low-specificity L-threonine aldolase [Idiomarina sp. MD25a]OIM99150.1 low-specificity L-threonine aldolase [Idiomarina sp. MD25a]
MDLRSDTVTQPTLAMRDAMTRADVGDDVYGEDATINALEQRVARWLGKEDALFCSSGTQSNLLGLLSHCRNGEEYIVGQEYHTYRYEAGGAAVLGGIVPQTIEVEADGTLSLDTIAERIKPNDPHFPITRLLAFENTHAGQVVSQDYFAQARSLAEQHGLKMHLDGARLVNAMAATQLTAAELAAPFDSVSVCCSKGLGAPVGSLLVGPADYIARARRWRKMVGGGMRQAGILAAAIDYALNHHLERIQDDHDNAKWLAATLQNLCVNSHIGVSDARTNMVYVTLPSLEFAQSLQRFMEENKIKVGAARKLRLVTHLDITRHDLERFTVLFEEFLKTQ